MNVTKPQQTVTLTPDEVIAACEAFVRAHHAELDGLNFVVQAQAYMDTSVYGEGLILKYRDKPQAVVFVIVAKD